MNTEPASNCVRLPRSPTGASEDSPQIFFDCTATLRSGGNTGIQRVVRNLVLQGPAAGSELGLTCIPVAYSHRTWYCIESLPQPEVRADITRHGGRRIAASIRDSLLWFRKRLRKAFVPRKVFQLSTKLHQAVVWRLTHQRVQFRPRDILLLPDAGWSQPDPMPLDQAKRLGVRVGFFSHDLIPLHFPHYQVPGYPESFERWLRQTLEHADFCVANSRATKQELCEFFEREELRYERLKGRVGWFPMGVSLDQVSPTAEVRPALRAVFERPEAPPPFLSVCTLEPRKNHATLLDAFDRLRRRRPETQLCLVGRPGWLCDDLIARINSHPTLGRQLHWFSDLTDTELDYCYRHAQTFVFPSFAEGFGLPVIEALRYGLTVLASGIPAHREIGSDFCHFFDPHSPEELTELMAACVGEGTLGSVRPATEFQPTDWLAASRFLWRECLRLARTVPDGVRRADEGPPVWIRHEAA